IPTGIGPVAFRRNTWSCQQLIAIINNVPGTIYVCFSETIPIIPILDNALVGIQSIKFQQLIHLRIGKTKVFIIPDIRDRVYFQIVKTSKNAFLRNSKASGKNSEIK